MNYEMIKGTTRAILVDVAEIGAALGSADTELGATIAANQDQRESVERALVELLEGGALFDLEPEDYTEAFGLLCTELGEPLPVADIAMFTDAHDPFAIPTDPMSCRISVLSSQDVAAFLNAYDVEAMPEVAQLQRWCQRANQKRMSIALFTQFEGQQTSLGLDRSLHSGAAVSSR